MMVLPSWLATQPPTPESNRHLILTPDDNQRLAKLCGPFDENLHLIERHLGVEISNRGNEFEIIGIPHSVDKAYDVLKELYKETAHKRNITPHQILLQIRSADYKPPGKTGEGNPSNYELTVHQTKVKPRTPNQQHYLKAIQKYDINFAIGPSGTGKTFLAVACAIAALDKDEVSRIVLTRPAVEAGESRGYLPGDF